MGCFLFLLGVEQVLYQIKQKIPRCCNRNSDNLMTTKTSTVRYSTTELSEDQGIFGFQSESSGSSRNLRFLYASRELNPRLLLGRQSFYH